MGAAGHGDDSTDFNDRELSLVRCWIVEQEYQDSQDQPCKISLKVLISRLPEISWWYFLVHCDHEIVVRWRGCLETRCLNDAELRDDNQDAL
jgi:hypothetical protein